MAVGHDHPRRNRAGRAPLGRAFGHLWAATAVSSLGDGLALVAFPLLAAALTADARLVAGVLAIQRLPWLLLAIGGGALADRFDRRKLLPAVELGRCAVLIVLGVLLAVDAPDTTVLLALYVAGFALGFGDTVTSAGVHAVLPALVGGPRLDRANGFLMSTMTAGEQFLGPAIGGLLFAAWAGAPFILDGVTFAAAALLLALAVPRRTTPAPTTPLSAELRDGVRHFVRSPLLRSLALVLATFAFCQAMMLGVLVLHAEAALGLTTVGFGLFLMLGGAGNVAGALVADRLHRRISTAAIVVGGGAIVALTYVVMGLTASVVMAGAAFAVEALIVAAANVVTMSLRQRVIPAHLLGRVGNAVRACIYGAIPLGALTGGMVAQRWGTPATLTAAGILQLALLLPTAARLRARVLAAERELATPLVIDLTDPALDPAHIG